jgi:hypothetical protein
MARAVCGVLANPPAAHAAVQDLLDSGFLREYISVIAREGGKRARDSGSPPPAAPPSGAGAGAGTALGGVAGHRSQLNQNS